MKISDKWLDVKAGKYMLYIENALTDEIVSYLRYFNTIKEAIDFVNNTYILKSCLWRLIRTKDQKNFTNKIYY